MLDAEKFGDLAEGSEFELPVPVSKLSDDGTMREFATSRRIALIARRLQCGRRYCRDVQRKHFAQRAMRDIIPLAEQGFGKYCRVRRKVACISALLRPHRSIDL